MHGPISVTAKPHGSEHRFPTATERKHASHSPICEPIRLTFGWAGCELEPGNFSITLVCCSHTDRGAPWHEAVAEKLRAGDLPGATVESPLGGKKEFHLRASGRTNAGLQQVLAMAK